MDKQVIDLIKAEERRQGETLTLIPSENYASQTVREVVGSKLMNKYSEGYSGKRYYQGNKLIDEIEDLAIERAKKLFGVPFVNVQPYSGSPANAAVYFALLEMGDKLMGLKLDGGGHLTHGHPKITFSGKYFASVQYDVEEDGFIDYDKLERQALEEKPKLMVIGTTAYPRKLDFARFSQIAEKVGAYVLADISHISGLVIGGEHTSPVPFADVVTTTTHKTLRGPRGAMIMVTEKGLKKDADLGKKIDKAVFPGLQGGPHDNQIAALAVALGEASEKSFTEYVKQVIRNAKVLADGLKANGFDLVTNGTDNHLMVMDLRALGKNGKDEAERLEEVGIVTNCNSVPRDINPPSRPSGIRLGTPAVTTRGLGEKEMNMVAGFIGDVILKRRDTALVKEEIHKLCKQFPIL